MDRCVGCGSLLQTGDKNARGYVRNIESKLCERCFKIQNYGEYLPIIKDEIEFTNMLEEINKTNDLVILVCDLFNLNPNMDLINEYIKNDVILVLTKRDILPRSLYEDKLLNYFKNINLNIIDRIVISSINNYHFDELIDKIRLNKKSNNVYVIGYTNVGKSTMINKLLYNYAKSNDVITTSPLPNTTIENINIKIDDELTLIDTPGVLDNGSIYYLKNMKELKRIIPKKAIKPISYQINKKQYVMVEDLFCLECMNNNIVMYISEKLKIDRLYKDIDINDMDKYEIDIKANHDIVLSGLGFIKFMKDEKITLYTIKGLKIIIRPSLI